MGMEMGAEEQKWKWRWQYNLRGQPTTFDHEGVLWDQWDKSATSKNVLEFLRIDQVDSENKNMG